MQAIIVPCVAEKVWDSRPTAGPAPAKDAYLGQRFAKWRSYAEASGTPWFILSTKYGLLRPDDPIEHYNVAVSQALRDTSLLQRLREQGSALGLDRCEQLILLDWDRFEPLVRAAVPNPAVACVLRHIGRAPA